MAAKKTARKRSTTGARKKKSSVKTVVRKTASRTRAVSEAVIGAAEVVKRAADLADRLTANGAGGSTKAGSRKASSAKAGSAKAGSRKASSAKVGSKKAKRKTSR